MTTCKLLQYWMNQWFQKSEKSINMQFTKVTDFRVKMILSNWCRNSIWLVNTLQNLSFNPSVYYAIFLKKSIPTKSGVQSPSLFIKVILQGPPATWYVMENSRCFPYKIGSKKSKWSLVLPLFDRILKALAKTRKKEEKEK